ncbi:unnamed protein product [Protopolystoma xenopodis]|uniref:Uncharacterized protein n=1 Tax=Protopolystoma xenopodis TaxID=117903 RepID=A0A3S5CCN7_9PLAT|nr:unnamed protein product [Protopolystoma xenopodis]
METGRGGETEFLPLHDLTNSCSRLNTVAWATDQQTCFSFSEHADGDSRERLRRLAGLNGPATTFPERKQSLLEGNLDAMGEEIQMSVPPEDDWLYWKIHADAVSEAISFSSGEKVLSFRPSNDGHHQSEVASSQQNSS